MKTFGYIVLAILLLGFAACLAFYAPGGDACPRPEFEGSEMYCPS